MPDDVKSQQIEKRIDREIVTAEFVRRILDYDPETGVFRWTYRADRHQCWNTRFAGTIAGHLRDDGYRYINISGLMFSANRIAWLYVHGEWPSELIDHKNRQTAEDQIDNLRAASRSQNNCNRIQKLGISGVKGVHFTPITGRWRAQIQFQRQKVHLGYFDTAEEAHDAYVRAAPVYHGDFARTE